MFGIVGLTLVTIAAPLLAGLWLWRELLAHIGQSPASALAPDRGEARAGGTDGPRLDRLIPAIIAISFYLLGLWRLGVPNELIFDEVHHARASAEFVAGKNPHEWTHPHLAKLLIAGSMLAWNAAYGDATFDPSDRKFSDKAQYSRHAVVAWRFASLVFGSMALALIYALSRELFQNRLAATFSAALLALDGTFFVMSRVAMTNIFTVFFIMLATLGVARHFRTRQLSWLWLTGLAMGCSLATRWSSVYAWFLLLVALLAWRLFSPALQQRFSPALDEEADDAPPLPALVPWAATLIGALFALPTVLYLASYIPFVLQGAEGTYADKLFSWDYNYHGWGKVFSLQRDMWIYHSTMKDTHNYNSPWWSWPLMLRPVWYFWRQSGTWISGVWCIGNAFIWWASVPALGTAAYLAVREGAIRRVSGSHARSLALIALLGLGLWLLWGVKARSLNFMHYMFESIPFACLALGYLLARIWSAASHPLTEENMGEDAGPDLRRPFVAVYGAMVAGWFLFYYPLLSALPIPDAFYRAHLWLGRPWI